MGALVSALLSCWTNSYSYHPTENASLLPLVYSLDWQYWQILAQIDDNMCTILKNFSIRTCLEVLAILQLP